MSYYFNVKNKSKRTNSSTSSNQERKRDRSIEQNDRLPENNSSHSTISSRLNIPTTKDYNTNTSHKSSYKNDCKDDNNIKIEHSWLSCKDIIELTLESSHLPWINPLIITKIGQEDTILGIELPSTEVMGLFLKMKTR